MKIIKTLLIIVTICLALLAGIFGSRIIPVRKVTCTNQFGKCSDNLADSLDSIKNTNLRNSKRNVKEILSNSVLVNEYSLHFEFPDTLEASLIERKAKFALVDKAGNIASIDESGRVLTFSENENIPSVIVSGTLPNVGTSVDQENLFALKLMYDVNYLYQRRLGEITKDGLVIEFGSGPNVLFPLEGEKERLIGSLVLIMSNLDEAAYKEGSKNWNIQTIDLRYDNPVLR